MLNNKITYVILFLRNDMLCYGCTLHSFSKLQYAYSNL